MERALYGVRIVDFTRLLPGPLASRWLVEHGAEVIKIEDPAGGDPTRWVPPFVGEPSQGSLFQLLNAGKRSVALDLRTDEGRAAALALAASADVVFESFRPGVMERLGLGSMTLHGRNPRLICVSLSGWGAVGPDANRPGHDLGYMARAGAVGLAGGAVPAAQVADVGGSLAAVAGIAMALFHRERTGEGAVLDLALSDVALAFNAVALAKDAGGERNVPGEEMLDGSRPAYSVYAARDGHVAVAALEPKFWSTFCSAIGKPELIPHGLDGGVRGASVREEVQEVLRRRSRDEWVQRFAGVDTCVEPVLLPDEVRGDPHHHVREALAADGAPRSALLREQVKLAPAPGLGSDTASVLEQLELPAGAREKLLARVDAGD